MTQSALAQAVACKQSAISMLESGQPEKLSQETVGKIAALLGVPLETVTVAEGVAVSGGGAGYCPNAACFSNVPYAVADDLFFWPRPQPSAAAGKHCAYCGELLERHCPHCGAAAVSGGACCPACGGGRVTNTLPPGTDPVAWAAQRRREIAEWRSLLS